VGRTRAAICFAALVFLVFGHDWAVGYAAK